MDKYKERCLPVEINTMFSVCLILLHTIFVNNRLLINKLLILALLSSY